MATAVVKRPITQQSTSTAMPPLPPPTAGKDQSRPVSAIPPAGGPASESWSEYSHYNSKLTIENFDLLKVRKTVFALCQLPDIHTCPAKYVVKFIVKKIEQVLGKGSFGKVMLVKKKDDESGMLYALKTLRKAALVKRNQLAHTSTERTILQNINCPFLVHLVFAFQTQDKLYMVLDYMGGGELFFWLKKDRKFSENRVRLYTAEITLALEALHNADIVYRDLKPENIL